MAVTTTISRSTLEAVLDAADADWDYEDTIRSYSGRGMYGDECAAIVLEKNSDVFAFFVALGMEVGDDLAFQMAGGACQDSMGLRIVVYWPRVTLDES